MGCKKKTIAYAKHAWQVLGPVLAPHVTAIVNLVGELEQSIPTLLTSNHDRRRVVIESTLAKAKAIGHDAYDDAKTVTVGELEGAIRSQIQRSLHLIREDVESWTELDDPADLNKNLDV